MSAQITLICHMKIKAEGGSDLHPKGKNEESFFRPGVGDDKRSARL